MCEKFEEGLATPLLCLQWGSGGKTPDLRVIYNECLNLYVLEQKIANCVKTPSQNYGWLKGGHRTIWSPKYATVREILCLGSQKERT